MRRLSLIAFTCCQIFLLYSQTPDAELVFQKTYITLKSGKLIKNESFDIKINNRAGEKFTKVAIPYSKMVNVSKINAAIIDDEGTLIKKLNKNDLIVKSAFADYSFYEDDFIKEFTLKHSIYPYHITYSYQTEQKEFLYIDYWLPVIDYKIPTLNAELTIEAPKDYILSFSSQYMDSFIKDTTEESITYSWLANYKQPLNNEIFSPPLNSFMPAVVIVPHEFKFEIPGSFDNWITYGDWQHELNSNLSELPQSEKIKISSQIIGITDKKEQIKKLYHFLQQQTRYVNISIETGGMKPYPASYVAQNKFGDCKALTNYFKSVLDVIGIKSLYTNVYAGGQIKTIDKAFPSQQFNHIILCIPMQPDTIWLDCTSDNPFNYLGTFTQNRDVFVVEKGKSFFTKTNCLAAQDVLETRNVKFSQGSSKNVDAVFNNSYQGEAFESLMYILKNYNETQQSQIIRNYFIESGYDLSSFKIVEKNRDSLGIYLSYTAHTNTLYNYYGNEILIGLLPFSIPKGEYPEKRKLPIQIDYPISKIDTLIYSIPKGYKVTNSLIAKTIVCEFGKYTLEFQQTFGEVTVIKRFLLNRGNYPVNKYNSLHRFLTDVNQIEQKTFIVFNKE